MPELSIDMLGYIAGTLTTICHLPQVIKIVRTKNVVGISLLTYLVLFTGIILWLIYGILIQNNPLIIFNIFPALFSSTIIIYILKYRNA